MQYVKVKLRWSVCCISKASYKEDKVFVQVKSIATDIEHHVNTSMMAWQECRESICIICENLGTED